MKSTSLKSLIVLSLILGATWPVTSPAEAGAISPGTYVDGTTVTVPADPGSAIDTSGNWTIGNGKGTLNIQGNGVKQWLSIGDGGTSNFNGNINVNITDWGNGDETKVLSNGTKFTLNGDLTVKLDSPNVDISDATPKFLNIDDASELTINGNVNIDVNSYSHDGAYGSMTTFLAGNGSKITVNGDVFDVRSKFINGTPSSGANTVYVYGNDTVVTINSKRCTIVGGGDKPDAVSVKHGSAILNINSATTQIVGSIDFGGSSTSAAALNAVFDGTNSFWYGDLSTNTTNAANEGTLNITFQNGAEYIPFGFYTKNVYGADKYLSAITLNNDGYINLYDVNAQQKWQEHDLLTRFPSLSSAKLDYILIKDLKGNGGGFRLDMNATNKANTDMVYVLNSSEGAKKFKVESYSYNGFEGITPTNTLRFATVAAAAAKNVAFEDTINLNGTSLWDYQLSIGHSAYDVNDPENISYNSKVGNLNNTTIDTLMAGGENWYVYQFTKTPANTVVDINTSTDTTYGLWRYDDTLRKRLGDARYVEDGEEQGIWTRLKTGKLKGSSFDSSYQMYQAGYDKKIGNTIYGVAIDHQKATSTYSHGNGDNSMTDLSFYATNYRGGGSYSDIVLRAGKVRGDLTSYGRNTSDYGDYDSWGYNASYEFGKNYRYAATGWFIEPSGQLIYGRLQGSDYTTDNGVKVNADGINSFLGRLGFTAGRKITKDSDYYFKANIYREFAGKGATTTYYGKDSLSNDNEHKDTWFELGLGGNLRLTKQTYMYGDILKTFGADIQKKWQVNIGARWTF